MVPWAKIWQKSSGYQRGRPVAEKGQEKDNNLRFYIHRSFTLIRKVNTVDGSPKKKTATRAFTLIRKVDTFNGSPKKKGQEFEERKTRSGKSSTWPFKES